MNVGAKAAINDWVVKPISDAGTWTKTKVQENEALLKVLLYTSLYAGSAVAYSTQMLSTSEDKDSFKSNQKFYIPAYLLLPMILERDNIKNSVTPAINKARGGLNSVANKVKETVDWAGNNKSDVGFIAINLMGFAVNNLSPILISSFLGLNNEDDTKNAPEGTGFPSNIAVLFGSSVLLGGAKLSGSISETLTKSMAPSAYMAISGIRFFSDEPATFSPLNAATGVALLGLSYQVYQGADVGRLYGVAKNNIGTLGIGALSLAGLVYFAGKTTATSTMLDTSLDLISRNKFTIAGSLVNGPAAYILFNNVKDLGEAVADLPSENKFVMSFIGLYGAALGADAIYSTVKSPVESLLNNVYQLKDYLESTILPLSMYLQSVNSTSSNNSDANVSLYSEVVDIELPTETSNTSVDTNLSSAQVTGNVSPLNLSQWWTPDTSAFSENITVSDVVNNTIQEFNASNVSDVLDGITPVEASSSIESPISDDGYSTQAIVLFALVAIVTLGGLALCCYSRFNKSPEKATREDGSATETTVPVTPIGIKVDNNGPFTAVSIRNLGMTHFRGNYSDAVGELGRLDGRQVGHVVFKGAVVPAVYNSSVVSDSTFNPNGRITFNGIDEDINAPTTIVAALLKSGLGVDKAMVVSNKSLSEKQPEAYILVNKTKAIDKPFVDQLSLLMNNTVINDKSLEMLGFTAIKS
jgi:hypothetical protein